MGHRCRHKKSLFSKLLTQYGKEMATLTSSLIFAAWMIALSESADVLAQPEVYEPDYNVYHNLSRILSDLSHLHKQYAEFLSVSDTFQSKAGKSQLLLRVSNFSSQHQEQKQRVKILLVFGEHAREFFPVESMFYLLQNLTRGIKEEGEGDTRSASFSSWVLKNFDIYVIAMANPDGRDFIERTENYCWRGTSSGVDMNRNFDWNYGQAGSSSNPHDGEFRGSHVFSEPETRVFRELAANISFDAFVSFHSGIRHIYIPFADTRSRMSHRMPENKILMLQLARKLAKASPSRPFKHGIAYELTGYTADGTSFDYMAGVAKIPFSLAIEMWEHKHHVGRSCFDEFNPHSDNLQEEVRLFHPLYVEIFSYLHHWKQSRIRRETLENWNPERHKAIRQEEKMNGKGTKNKLQETFLPVIEEEEDDLASEHNSVMLFLLLLFLVGFVVLMTRHFCQMMKRKRIVSLRSLSSTFSLLKG